MKKHPEMVFSPNPGGFLFVIYPYCDFSFFPLTTAFIGGRYFGLLILALLLKITIS